MAHGYGVRYIPVDQFINYCKDLNVKTEASELEYYEQTGVMLPTARVIYPDEYVVENTRRSRGAEGEQASREWPELERLSERLRIDLGSYASLTDEELVEPFDREMGSNPFLTRPQPGDFRPWNSYKVAVPIRGGETYNHSTVEHYYSYWQVHQLDFLQKYPDLYENRVLLDHIPDGVKTRILRPLAPNKERLCSFDGKAHRFDALSFWVTVATRERNRTFAQVPEIDGVRELDTLRLQDYRDRLRERARSTLSRFSLIVEDLHNFLFEIVELYSDYRREERSKLSDELKKDAFSLAQLLEIIAGEGWDRVADELGKRTLWAKQTFRHMDVSIKERDEARNVLVHVAGRYGDTVTRLGISSHSFAFTDSEADGLLDYCERQGLSLLLTALSGMVATEDEYAEKFRRVTRYTNLKNLLTSFEYLLKDLAARGSVVLTGRTLTPVVQSVMNGESEWISLFARKVGQGKTNANNTTEFLTNLRYLQSEPELVRSEDTFWARVFLMTCLARNGTVHGYPSEDWYYGDLFGEMLNAVVFAIFYTWQLATRRRWV